MFTESPEGCAVLCLATQSCPTLCNPMDCSPPGSSVHGDSPGKNTGGLPCPPPGDLPNLRIEPRSPTLQVDSLLSEPPGKPVNTGVGSLSLLQGSFPTQGIKPGSPTLQVDSLQSEPPGKPENTGVGSLSLLQGNLLTQGIKPGSPALQVDSLAAELPGKSFPTRLSTEISPAAVKT